MRRLLTFECDGARCGASLDFAQGETGLLIVSGGTQTRTGSHRIFERLGRGVAEAGFPALRFDRRGVGDSEGEDPGWRGSGGDIAAAAAALRTVLPAVRTVVGLGLCDGASALALHGRAAGLDALVLVNPWLVETEAGQPAPAAIRSHYLDRLKSREGWRKLLTGAVDWRKLAGGLRRSAGGSPSPLADEIAAALRAGRLPTELILARGDATADAAAHEVKIRAFKGLIAKTQTISSDSHTFARPGDADQLLAATLASLRRLAG
jgi:exosortase A-associated hydrolase 1